MEKVASFFSCGCVCVYIYI